MPYFLAPHLLASRPIFTYPSGVKKFRNVTRRLHALGLLCCILFFSQTITASPQQPNTPAAPIVTKVEPPGWWIGLTPEVMLLLSGHNLQATQVSCNLPTLRVTHTQATAGGDYLFVWLKIGADTRSGTAICRIATETGEISFELPLRRAPPTAGKFQGLSQSDVLYLHHARPFRQRRSHQRSTRRRARLLDRSKAARLSRRRSARHSRTSAVPERSRRHQRCGSRPILKNGATQDYHGYGAVDLYAVDPHLGSLQDYQELVTDAHRHGHENFLRRRPQSHRPESSLGEKSAACRTGFTALPRSTPIPQPAESVVLRNEWTAAAAGTTLLKR